MTLAPERRPLELQTIDDVLAREYLVGERFGPRARVTHFPVRGLCAGRAAG